MSNLQHKVDGNVTFISRSRNVKPSAFVCLDRHKKQNTRWGNNHSNHHMPFLFLVHWNWTSISNYFRCLTPTQCHISKRTNALTSEQTKQRTKQQTRRIVISPGRGNSHIPQSSTVSSLPSSQSATPLHWAHGSTHWLPLEQRNSSAAQVTSIHISQQQRTALHVILHHIVIDTGSLFLGSATPRFQNCRDSRVR